MHEHGLIKRALKKHQKKMNITQIDVKDIKLGILSGYQYSAKDVVTGVSFFCYAFKFAQAILEHLKGYGINLREITFQTDNGSEFIGCIFKKKPSGFTELVEKVYPTRHQGIVQAIETFNFELFLNLERGNLNKVSPMSPTRSVKSSKRVSSSYNLENFGINLIARNATCRELSEFIMF
jgi:hypothetical protein